MFRAMARSRHPGDTNLERPAPLLRAEHGRLPSVARFCGKRAARTSTSAADIPSQAACRSGSTSAVGRRRGRATKAARRVHGGCGRATPSRRSSDGGRRSGLLSGRPAARAVDHSRAECRSGACHGAAYRAYGCRRCRWPSSANRIARPDRFPQDRRRRRRTRRPRRRRLAAFPAGHHRRRGDQAALKRAGLARLGSRYCSHKAIASRVRYAQPVLRRRGAAGFWRGCRAIGRRGRPCAI